MIYGTLLFVSLYYILPLWVMVMTPQGNALKFDLETSLDLQWKLPFSPG